MARTSFAVGLLGLMVWVAFLVRQGLSRADQWSSAVGLFITVGFGGASLWLARPKSETPAQLPPADPRESRRPGKRLTECDPLALEVHPAAGPEDGQMPLPPLPIYVPRRHDTVLRVAVAEAEAGESRLVMLVGGSSAGKTRACWEAVHGLPDNWWLWHPIDPRSPAALADRLSEVEPRTVIWLNDAQHYLLAADPDLGERVASGLRTLLGDRDRGPVLVLGTIWPEYWARLTAAPQHDVPDPYAQARKLLVGSQVVVPESFGSADLTALHGRAAQDLRLRQAAELAEGSRITQYLAGVPRLLERYRTAPVAARAVIHVAVDARRFGFPRLLPRALFEGAVPGYLTGYDWANIGEDWLDKALEYTGAPCHGVSGPVTRVRPRLFDPNSSGNAVYVLADSLEQAGGIERAGIFPPATLWEAMRETVSGPEVLRSVAGQIERRGRFRRAVSLCRAATEGGDTRAMARLAVLFDRAGNREQADSAAMRAAVLGDTGVLRELAHRRQRSGDGTSAATLYRQAANFNDMEALRSLGRLREADGDILAAISTFEEAIRRGSMGAPRDLTGLYVRFGDLDAAVQTAERAAEASATGALRDLAGYFEREGDETRAERLYRQAADRGDVVALRALGWFRESAGDVDAAEALYRQAADRGDEDAQLSLTLLHQTRGHSSNGGSTMTGSSARILAQGRERAGDVVAAEALYLEAADNGDINALWNLAGLRARLADQAGAEEAIVRAAKQGRSAALRALAPLRVRAGDLAGAEALYREAADLGDIAAIRDLANLRERCGDDTGAEDAALYAADRGGTGALRDLARRRERSGDLVRADVLYRQALDRGDIVALWNLVATLESMGEAQNADRLRRFGMNDDGTVAIELD